MREPTGLPYQRKDSFLTPTAIAYYKVLRLIFGARYLIFAQVRVVELCDVVNRPVNQRALKRIDRKHVDFVLCHPRTFKPMVAIELHASTGEHRPRDSFLDEVFRAIGMRLVSQRVRLTYSVAEVTQLVEAALAAAA